MLINIDKEIKTITSNESGEEVRDAICESIRKFSNNFPDGAAPLTDDEMTEVLS